MTGCPTCHSPIDGLYCRRCHLKAHRTSPPPMGFEGLRAMIAKKRDSGGDAERAAIQGEA